MGIPFKVYRLRALIEHILCYETEWLVVREALGKTSQNFRLEMERSLQIATICKLS